MLGIVDWLATECAHHGVDIKTNTLAEEADVLGLEPDVVVVATGGLPNISFLEDGEQLVTTTWDILAGQVSPGADVLLFDDNAAHPGPTCAEYLTAAGARLEFVSPERVFLPDVGGLNYPAYLKALYNAEATITLNLNLRSVTRQGNKLVAHLYNQYNKSWQERLVDQVVVEHGTLPMDDLYFALKPRSSNLGELDLAALVEGRPQSLVNDPQGRFQLFRVGDAVASRNIHAAIYESLRICKDL
jgi:NADPH-dependent 2,4-dienoyl-CoA reductase/sulfur reductase-like enzyme